MGLFGLSKREWRLNEFGLGKTTVIVKTPDIEPIFANRFQRVMLNGDLLHLKGKHDIVYKNNVVFVSMDDVVCLTKFDESTIVFATNSELRILSLKDDFSVDCVKVINIKNIVRIYPLNENMVGIVTVNNLEYETLLLNRVSNQFIVTSKAIGLAGYDMLMVSKNQLIVIDPHSTMQEHRLIEEKDGLFDLNDIDKTCFFNDKSSRCVATQKYIILVSEGDCYVFDKETKTQVGTILMDRELYTSVGGILAFEKERFAILYVNRILEFKKEHIVLIEGLKKRKSFTIDRYTNIYGLQKISENSFYIFGKRNEDSVVEIIFKD